MDPGGNGDGDGQRRGDAIRLVGEMDIDKPAYLQVRTAVLCVCRTLRFILCVLLLSQE